MRNRLITTMLVAAIIAAFAAVVVGSMLMG